VMSLPQCFRIQPGRGNPPAQAVIQDVDGVSLLW
jgi:hypothetical protein